MVLYGAVLLTAILPYSVFTQVHKNGEGKLENYSGNSPDIMNQLEEMLNLKDGKYGGKKEDCSWNRIVGMLIDKEVDLVTSGVPLTANTF
jgi:hypothetical protein